MGDVFGLTTDDFAIFTAKDLYFKPDSVIDVTKWMGQDTRPEDQARIFTFGAADEVFLEGKVEITNHGHIASDEALAIGGGGNLIINDADLSYDGANLGLGAGESVLVMRSSISSEGHLAMGALELLILEEVHLSAGTGNRVSLYSDQVIDATGLEFSDGLRQVYMDASTINLRNVDFPAGSEVRLVSKLGGIDGKYPTFGTLVGGRVNFISNVSYGCKENVMNDRASFDRFGQDISIESFGQL